MQTPEKQEDSLEVPSEIDSSKPKETNSTDTTTLLKSRSMPKINRSYTFPYDLDKPDFKGNLPKELIEISGLTYNSKNNTLLAINDEAGRLYTLDATDFNLIEKKEFGNNGDYEGIEIVGDIVYVLKANGDITPIDIKKPKVKKTIKTPLTTANDVEGLGFDPTTNELILACKGTPALKKKHKLKNTKAFYAFDLDRKELNDYPKFTISDEQLEDFFKDYFDEDLSKKKRKKLKNRLLDFSPSAIAKHPMDENFYILSSIGKVLLVCNSYGRIADVQFLNDKKFSQPEGICFAPDGTLYISNEGRSMKGTVMRFRLIK
ncbi:MAG: hypothetical protein ACI8YQ_000299 [Polaribacter sp.]